MSTTDTSSSASSNPQHRLAIGDIFEDTLVPASRGVKTKLKVNGRPCFVEGHENHHLAGDVWKLELTGENPSRTVYFCEAQVMVRAGDELGQLYGHLGHYDLTSIREAHKLVRVTEEACTEDSPGLAATLAQIAKITTGPNRYRHDLANRAWAIYEKHFEVSNERFLELARVLAYTAADADKEQAFRYLLAMYDNHSHKADDHKARALANLAELLHARELFAQATEYYEQALALVEDSYVSSKLADCLTKLGRWEEAYRLIEHFPDMYFSLVEGEWSEPRMEFVYEPYHNPKFKDSQN